MVLREEIYSLSNQVHKLKNELSQIQTDLYFVKENSKFIKNCVNWSQDTIEQQKVTLETVQLTSNDNKKQLEAIRQFLEMPNCEAYGDDNWPPVNDDHSITSVLRKSLETIIN